MSFEVKVVDMAGDEIRISSDLIEDWRNDGGLAFVEIHTSDMPQEMLDDEGDGPLVILNRDHLVALRSAIDMILTADEARQSPPGKSPSTT